MFVSERFMRTFASRKNNRSGFNMVRVSARTVGMRRSASVGCGGFLASTIRTKVDGVPLVKWLESELATWGAYQEISCLLPEKTLKELKRAMEEVERIAGDVTKAVPPIRVEEFRATLRDVVPKFLEVVDTAKDFKPCFDELVEKDAAQERVSRRNARAVRDRVMQKLEGANCPRAAAKMFADILQDFASGTLQEPAEFQCDETDAEAVSAALDAVQLLSPNAQSPSWLHDRLKAYFDSGDKLHKIIVDKAAQIQAGINGSNGATRHGFATVVPSTPFAWSPGEENVLQVQPGVRIIVHCQESHAFDIGHAAWPWKGAPMLVTVVSGSACCFVLTPDKVPSLALGG